MQHPLTKLAIIGAVLLFTILISGCGAIRMAYGQAPDIVYWWLDGYADFNDTQAEHVREDVRAFFDWHSATQLPSYAQLLTRARTQVLDPEPITPARVCRWYEDIVSHADPMIEHALPAAARTLMSLTPHQLEHVRRKQDKVNAKLRGDHLQPDLVKRLDAAVARVVNRTESLYGRLDGVQKEQITRLVAASPFDPATWLAERQQRQRDLVAVVRTLQAARAPPVQAQAALRLLVANIRRSPREAYRLYDERLRAYNCMVAAHVHNGMSGAQREEAAERLKRWADDFQAMSSNRH